MAKELRKIKKNTSNSYKFNDLTLIKTSFYSLRKRLEKFSSLEPNYSGKYFKNKKN
jgi:hypothetical protein